MASGSGRPTRRTRSRWDTLRSWLFTTDSTRIGIMWIVVTLLFFFIGGIAALFMRTELALPGSQIMGPDDYNGWFTLHGTAMMFFFAVPVFFGFGSLLVPRMLGREQMAFPRLNTFDFWLIFLGGALFEIGSVFGVKAISGWTSYVPLSMPPFDASGIGQDLWALGIALETLGGALAGANFLVTIFRLRPAGMGLMRMPIFVWGILLISGLTLLAAPFLIAALVFMFLDRQFGTLFFTTAGSPGSLLWQDIFWFYSHPATYVMVFPAWAIATIVIPRFARRPLFSYRAIVFSFLAIFVLSWLVWWHHMFVTGMNVGARAVGSIASMLIGVPSGVLVFTWIATLYKGRIRFTTPMLFALSIVVLFTIAGANGMFMAMIPFDVYAHDTYWLVSHFHYMTVGVTLMGVFAGVYYWFPSAFGRQLSETLGKWHFWGTFIGMNLTFFTMQFIGLAGGVRRVWDYPVEFTLLHFVTSVGAFLIALAQLAFFVNVYRTLRYGKRFTGDPWGPVDESGFGTMGALGAPYDARGDTTLRDREALE